MLAAAMDGAMTFHTALRKRLDIIKPSRSFLTKTLTLRPPSQHLSPNVRQLVALLHSRKVAVYLVSGGFKVPRSHAPTTLAVGCYLLSPAVCQAVASDLVAAPGDE